jgi:hypothetical protein
MTVIGSTVFHFTPSHSDLQNKTQSNWNHGTMDEWHIGMLGEIQELRNYGI